MSRWNQGADQYMYQRRPRHPIRMADDDRRVRPRIGEIAGPNVPLFYAPSTFKVEVEAVRRSARLAAVV